MSTWFGHAADCPPPFGARLGSGRDSSIHVDIQAKALAEFLARTVINIGNVLKLTFIAVGVETQAQRDFVSDHGCHLYQGHLFPLPLPPEDFARWVEARR